MVTRSGGLDAAARARLASTLARAGLDADIAWAVHAPDRLMPDGRRLGELKGKRVYLMSGIAAPASFAETVRGLGGQVVGERAHGDHHAFTAGDLMSAATAARDAAADVLLATGKDEPKLGALGPTDPPLCFLEVIVRLDPNGEGLLDGALKRLSRPPSEPT